MALQAGEAGVRQDGRFALLACDGEVDHLYLFIENPPRLSVSVLVNTFKGTSSRLLRKEGSDMARRYLRGTLRLPSYFAAATAGESLAVVRQYVARQRASSSP